MVLSGYNTMLAAELKKWFCKEMEKNRVHWRDEYAAAREDEELTRPVLEQNKVHNSGS
jgi:hypothetical protein